VDVRPLITRRIALDRVVTGGFAALGAGGSDIKVLVSTGLPASLTETPSDTVIARGLSGVRPATVAPILPSTCRIARRFNTPAHRRTCDLVDTGRLTSPAGSEAV
jgi:hypothetical protein